MKRMGEMKVPADQQDRVYLRHLISKFTALNPQLPVHIKADYFVDAAWKTLPLLRV
jgi:hypothetical protein